MKSIASPHDTIRVLHVDDNESQLLLAREYFKVYDPDISYVSVNDPLRVLDVLREDWFDCLVSDYQMPGLNGIELASRVRDQSRIPFILYTGKGSEEVAEKAFSVGVNDYFRKETNAQHYQVLAKKIREVVKQRRVEDIYTKVVRDSRDALIIVLRGQVVYGNQSFASLVGVEVDEVVNVDLFSFIPRRDREMVRELMDRLYRGETEYYHGELEVKGDDTISYVEITASVINYLGERALLCNIRDITDRKTLEDKLKQSELRYRSLLELAPDGVLTLNLNGDITWTNTTYTEITGFSIEEVLGKKAWSIGAVRGTDVKMFLKALFNLLCGKTVPPMEFQWVNKNGDTCWGEGRASLLKTDGKRREVLLILRDITERKKLENDLSDYAKNLEILADERAQRLVDSEKMVAVGAMASSIAHDLRGPLAVIRNSVYLMEKGSDDEKMRKDILDAVENAVHMLDEIRGKTNIMDVKLEPVELSGFVESILRETPLPGGVSLETELCSVFVDLDRLRFRRVLENLARNAVEAMSGNGALRVTSRVEGDMVLLSVKDSGAGISKEIYDDLFRPFKTGKENGTGLGLYYCKKTVEAHGGSINVRTRIGVGTEFEIVLPLGEMRDTGVRMPDSVSVFNEVASNVFDEYV